MFPISWNSLLAKLALPNHKIPKRRKRVFASRRLRLESLESRQLLAITVDNPMDELDLDSSPGDYSLREAIRDANPASDTIEFDPSIMNGATISLLPGPGFGQIEFSKNLTIDASMLPNGITIDGNDPDRNVPEPIQGNGIRIFNITAPNPSSPPLVTLIGLKLTGGDVSGAGGAISSSASLTLQECIITGNHAAGIGGGLYVDAPNTTVKIENSTIRDNAGHGGRSLHRQAA